MTHGRKTGGRKKGTVNKVTKDLRERFAKEFPQLDPVIGMMEMAQEELAALKSGAVVSMAEMMEAIQEAMSEGDPRKYNEALRKITASKNLILDCFKGAAPYIHAKLKAVDMKVEGNIEASIFTVTVEE